MGKRELLLIVAFVVLGAVVYQVTAPAPPPGTEGASFSGIWHSLQHHVRGRQAVASVDATESAPAEGLRELRITIPNVSNITVHGEERSDISAAVHVEAHGYDDREARAAAGAPHLRLERAGDTLLVRTELARVPPSTPSAQVTLTLKVPRQLAVHVEPNFGPLAIANVAAVEVAGARGELHVSSIDGTVNITHSGPVLSIDGCRELKLTNRGGVSTITNVTGQAVIEPTGGRLTIDHVIGPLDIETHGGDLTLTGLDALKSPLRVNGTGGRLRINGLKTAARVETRNTPIDITLAAAVPVTIYSTAEDITITPPAAGYTLDAAATGGHLTLADGSVAPSTAPGEERASGSVRGGGPTLVLRSTHADITVRAHASGK